ncbi:MAG: hypothetical protein HY043_09805 [Verrucomicrobia bacterium]|nr:hypothetical protein [Verrucomicrobiota bacterium]
MKHVIFLCAAMLACHSPVKAGPLIKEQIPADAKWLLHLDGDNLRGTKLGDYLFNQVLGKQLAGAGEQFHFDFSNVLQKVGSLTAYGTDFKKGPEANGVLLINSDGETRKALQGLLAAQLLADTNGPVKKMEQDSRTLYSIANEIFLTLEADRPVIVSKSRSEIDRVHEVLAGKGPSVAANKTFSGYPTMSNGFFFIGVAEGFSAPDIIPPQAKALQMADGGRLALGESADRLSLNLSLRGKSAEVTKQIQQVLEGMVALISLGQPENEDLMQLARSTKVSSTPEIVTLMMEFPVAKALAMLNEHTKPAEPKKPKARHVRRIPKPKEEDVEPAKESAPAKAADQQNATEKKAE